MRYFLKAASIALLALMVLAPAALAKKKVIIVNHYTPADDTVYVTEKTSPDLGLVTFNSFPEEKTTEQVYVDGQLVGETTKVKMMGLAPGTHKVELRDADGNVIWIEPSVRVVKHETSVIYPQ